MTSRPYDPTPEQKARAQLSTQPGLAVLSDAQPETLLTAYAALTRRIHETAARYAPMPEGCTPGEVADLRRQRDLLQHEMLRRMAGAL